MINWKRFFTSSVLWRGQDYFERGLVEGISYNQYSCTARVRGTRIYHVSISGLNSGLLRMFCDCSYAGDGFRCKHMAAVLYQWESEIDSKEKASGKKALKRAGKRPEDLAEVLPFGEADPAVPARYFDMAVMTGNLKFRRSTVSAAEKLVKDGIVRLSRVNFGYEWDYAGADSMTGTAFGVWGEERPQKLIRADFDRGGIRQMNCDVCGHHYYGNYYYGRGQEFCCEHTAALLLLLDEYIRLNDPGDDTSAAGAYFLESFDRPQDAGRAGEITEKTECVSLKPRLIREYEGYYLSFRTGSSRLYVIKDLSEYVRAAEEGGALSFGKTGYVDFRTETFTREAAPWFEFLAGRVREQEALYEQMKNNHRYYGAELRVGGGLMLSGDVLDGFYDLALGQSIDYQDKYEADQADRMEIRDDLLSVPLVIGPPEDGHTEGLIVKGVFPEFLQGSRHRYFVRGHRMSRLSNENYRQLRPLLEASAEGNLRMVIGKKRMAEFYYRILPVLKENPCLEVSGELDPEVVEALPPEAHFFFYLDAEEGRLLLSGKVCYGEHTHTLKVPEKKDLPYPVYRDRAQEGRALSLVSGLFPVYDPETESFSCGQTDEEVYRILSEGVRELMGLGEVQGTDAFRRLRIRPLPKVKIGVSVQSEIMNLDILTSDMSSDELLELLDSYRKKKNWHRLRNGDFISLEEKEHSLAAISEVMDSLGVTPREFTAGHLDVPLYRALYLDRMLADHDEIAADRDRSFRNLVRNFKTIKESDYEIPENLRPVMRSYQSYGFKWIRTLSDAGFGGILADEMGLGKTLQMISVLLAEKEEGREGTALVVCPASLVYNWQEEIRRFAPSLAVRTVTGNLPARHRILEEAAKEDVLVTSYDLLKRDAALYGDLHFSWMIIDEAQYIKNPRAAASKAVKIIRASRRMALTGTPIENRLSELWSIFDFLMPGFLYSYERFREEMETPIAKNHDEGATERLRRMTGPFILRRLKGDVLKDLPEKLEEVRYAGFEEEQRRLYDAQVVHMRELLNGMESAGEGRMRILAELTKIRQICCDPSLLTDGYKGESAKRSACLELIGSAIDGGHRMLVFSQFTSMLSLLEEDLQREGIAYYKITGSTPKEERLRLVTAFNSDEVPVFLISLKAGGTGLNLTGADMVIHYDPWWNLAAQNQATDRAHRIGQTRTVSVFRLIAKDTIEEKILLMQEAKKDLADAILSGESESLSSMTKEELLELLS